MDRDHEIQHQNNTIMDQIAELLQTNQIPECGFLRRKTQHVYSSLFLFVHDTHQNSVNQEANAVNLQCRDMYWDPFHPSSCRQNCIKTCIKITACVCIWKPSKQGWSWWWFLSVALHICISWKFSVDIELKSLSSLFWSQWNSCWPVLIHLFMRFYFCLALPTRHAWPTRWACALAPAFSPATLLSLVYLVPHTRLFFKSPMNVNYSTKLYKQ